MKVCAVVNGDGSSDMCGFAISTTIHHTPITAIAA
jgi:hypothetical protein